MRISAKKTAISFTLIELMLTVCILSIGIVAILRSFMATISGLDSAERRIEAMQFLERKMSNLEELAKAKRGKFENEEGQIIIKNYTIKWQLESTLEELPSQEDEELKIKEIERIALSIQWNEGQRRIKETLVGYFYPPQKE